MCEDVLYDFGVSLGRNIANPTRQFVCGGMGGFMEAVCKGVKSSQSSFLGQTIGILPSSTPQEANQYIDIVLPTGLGIGRNLLVVQAADILIAAGGGAGTLSEIAIAWQLEKQVLCVTKYDGWAKELAGKCLDHRASGLLIPVRSIDEIINFLNGSEGSDVP